MSDQKYLPHWDGKYKPSGVRSSAGEPGFNEYGVPLSRCAGSEHDEHYWAWIRAVEVPRYAQMFQWAESA